MLAKKLQHVLAGLLAVWVLLVTGLAAHAHPMPESRVWVDTQSDGVQLTLEMPLNRLEFAYGQPLADAPAQVLPRHADALRRYVLRHVGIHSPSGAVWAVSEPALSVRGADGSAELEAVLAFRAPSGVDPRRFVLSLDAVTHEVKTHQVQVLVRSDWSAGQLAGVPTPLGTLDARRMELPVTLPAGRVGGGFVPLLLEGIVHIFEGTDHLVFLLLLLMVAPLAAQHRQWQRVRTDRAGLWRQVVWVVTAFTLGHSVTLVLGSTGLLSPPVAWVETAVAITIGLAAVHVVRPLWPAAEPWMALAFGLIHGQAFSASLSGVGLTAWRHAAALLAFNLGIEIAQLLLVLVAVPALWMIARSSTLAYAVLRRVAGWAGGFLSVLWVLERSGVSPDARIPWPEPGVAMVPAALVLLWLLALGLRLRHTAGQGRSA